MTNTTNQGATTAELISEIADLAVYAAQADGVEDHAIEAHCTNAVIRRLQDFGQTFSDSFCQDVRDQIMIVIG